MITIDELDKHIMMVRRAIRSNENRKPENQLEVYCFDCSYTDKKRNYTWWCSYDHNVYFGDMIVLYNLMRFFLRVNRTRKTLKNKFGRPKKLPMGFSPDIQDRILDKSKERELDKFK